MSNLSVRASYIATDKCVTWLVNERIVYKDKTGSIVVYDIEGRQVVLQATFHMCKPGATPVVWCGALTRPSVSLPKKLRMSPRAWI